MILARSSSDFQMGTITISTGASSGGTCRPLSSPCVITNPPTRRVETPQLVFQANSVPPASVWNFRSKTFAKFCPRLCEVPTWSPLLSCIIASQAYVLTAPANFSASDFTPVMTGIAM